MTYVWDRDTIRSILKFQQSAELDLTLDDTGHPDIEAAAAAVVGCAEHYVEAAQTFAVDVVTDDLKVLHYDRRLFGGLAITIGWWPRNRPAELPDPDVIGLIQIAEYTADPIEVAIHCTDPGHDHYTMSGERRLYRIAGWREDERRWVLEEADA